MGKNHNMVKARSMGSISSLTVAVKREHSCCIVVRKD